MIAHAMKNRISQTARSLLLEFGHGLRSLLRAHEDGAEEENDRHYGQDDPYDLEHEVYMIRIRSPEQPLSSGAHEGSNTFRAMVLDRPRTPLVIRERPVPVPAAGEILIEISACGYANRSARGRRRVARPQAPDHSRTRDRWPRRRVRRGRFGPRRRCAGRPAVARRDMRRGPR
jgi:hypothetical protein